MNEQLNDEQLSNEQISDEQAHVNDALVYSMRDLNQQTARIMNEVEKSGKPAFITKHGRFVAVIRPLPSSQVQQRIIAEMAREFSERGQS